MSSGSENYSSEFSDIFGSNAGFIEELYELYKSDPGLVSEAWARFFAGLVNGEPTVNGNGSYASYAPAVSLEEQAKVSQLVQAYRQWGHLGARMNPLSQGIFPLPEKAILDIESYGFSHSDLEGEFFVAGFAGNKRMPLKKLIDDLKEAYCGSIGFEHQHIVHAEARQWLIDRIERRPIDAKQKIDTEIKKRILKKLIDSEVFESELHKKYIGHKRFSLEGGETLIPMLDRILEKSGDLDINEVVIGMAHRGRLNVLSNTLGKPLREIFSEFDDLSIYSKLGSGDVKYHLGYKSSYQCPGGKSVKLSLAPNPSHLEFVNPVVQGVARAKQDVLYARRRSSVLPILIHGDAAFSGQGVVYETINFSGVEGYRTGGTVNIIINNQVGFTTSADEGRTATYCTDVAKILNSPIFHVNCEDVEAACWAVETALEYRNNFGYDVFIDLFCYRKYGHNEADDPSFTQPLVYAEIKEKLPVSELYGRQLVKEGTISESELEELKSHYRADFETAHRTRKPGLLGEACAMHGMLRVENVKTSTSLEVLKRVAASLVDYPQDFVPHPKLNNILQKRVESLDSSDGIDWGFAEGLAFGSLVLEGHSVRLSGQDCARGTFSQRHLALDDYKKPQTYLPFSRLQAKESKAAFEVLNSTLSESGILGFEFGYSSVASDSLVLWEAQFGDFCNGAQVIIDQFIASSEAKWYQLSGLVMLLPHGFEGQGPEHSSARLERFLQLCAEGNLVVCVPSNAAQHFHLLRRQALSRIKRPLVVMTPKSLLRLPEAASSAKDLYSGEFKTIIEKDFTEDSRIDHVLLMSGKIYYDVADALKELKNPRVKVIRVEQLYPFPQFELKRALRDLKIKKLTWVQEEPQNMGAFSYIEPYLRIKTELKVEYIGRPVSASVATGSTKRHLSEQRSIIDQVLDMLGQKK